MEGIGDDVEAVVSREMGSDAGGLKQDSTATVDGNDRIAAACMDNFSTDAVIISFHTLGAAGDDGFQQGWNEVDGDPKMRKARWGRDYGHSRFEAGSVAEDSGVLLMIV